MPYETLKLNKKGDVLIVTLNRPEKKNAISPAMAEELASLCHSLGHHGSSAKAMVMCGGEGLFCAGLDPDLLAELDDHATIHLVEDLSSVFQAFLSSGTPVVAVIDGPALGAGLDLAVTCDIRLASPRAKFGQPEITLGIAPFVDPLWKIVGLGRAREMSLTGMTLTAEEAYRIGLVNKLYSSEELFDRAVELASDLAQKDHEAMEATKRNLRFVPGMETIQALEIQAGMVQGFLDSRSKRQILRENFHKRRTGASQK